jgi:hypothetical protein
MVNALRNESILSFHSQLSSEQEEARDVEKKKKEEEAKSYKHAM